jgi:type III secretion protein N (ATPase)
MKSKLGQLQDTFSRPISHFELHQKRGCVVTVSGTIVKAIGIEVKIGEICRLVNANEQTECLAEVVGLHEQTILLALLGRPYGIGASTEVIPSGMPYTVPVGPSLLGRVIDGLGRPLDLADRNPLTPESYRPIYGDPPNPLHRKVITHPFSLGVRAIDGLMTCCEGQRLGIFAGAGYGKSTLLGMMACAAEADVTVIGFIGERGREVREFLENNLTSKGRQKAVVVVSTSDRPAMERIKAAYTATTIAEYFRDRGQRVLLLLDSITRFARAQREIGLAAGEPPTRRGYPPSFFSQLPILLERAGRAGKGSITAIYTVLVEGDDLREPVADEMRSLLDGHIVLSADLMKKAHYPAVDVLNSISRVMNQVVSAKHVEAAAKIRTLLAKYDEIELLVKIGEYKQGSDPEADKALEKIGPISDFLRQQQHEVAIYQQTLDRLFEVVDG